MKLKTLFLIIVILVAILALSKRPKFFHVPKWLQPYAKFNAITLPPFGMFFSKGNFVESTIKHELVHWEQYKRFGLLGFYMLYGYYTLKYGYWNNPLELEAYET